MGSRPAREKVLTTQEISKCYKLLSEADERFDSSIIPILFNRPPLSSHFLQKLLLSKAEKSKVHLQNQLISTFPISNTSYTTFITLHQSRCRNKSGYFEYLNSMRSLYSLHKLKQELLTKDLLKQSKAKVEVLDRYLKEIKGTFSIQGICELQQLLAHSTSPFKMFLFLFQQTFRAKKILESDFHELKNVDKSELTPKGFEEAQEKVEEDLYQLQFPTIY